MSGLIQPDKPREIQIDELVVDRFKAARDLLFDIFSTDDTNLISDLSPVVNALRGFDPQAMEIIGRPVVENVLKEVKVDPKTDEGRTRGVNFAETIAFAVHDAASIYQQNILAAQQRKAIAHSAIAQGRGDVLQG